MKSEALRVTHVINNRFVDGYPGEVARALEKLPSEDIVEFLASRAPEGAGAVLARLAPDMGAEVMEKMDAAEGASILSTLDPARSAALLSRLEENARTRYLNLLEKNLAREIRALIAYPLDSAGHLMDPYVRGFRLEARVQDVLDRLRTVRVRTVVDVFLIDDENRLVGSVSLQEIAIASPEDVLGSLARGVPAHVRATASREEVLEQLQTRRVSSLPVVDLDGRLLGVIRSEGLVEAAQEEASVDIQTMVGASKEERALSPPMFAVRKRLPWLEINLGTAFLAAAVVGMFEDTIAKFTALAVLLPVVAGQSGNTGSQALAVTMRGLALREIRVRHWFAVCRKEVLAAGLNGVAVAATTALGVFLWSRSPGLALVIGVSMVLSMIMAGLSGATIPVLLTAFGQDPAQSSSIILTTVTDVIGFLSFLGIATALSFML